MLHIGVGVADITPPVGVPLSGFIARENRPSTHIYSRLQVRVLAVEAGDEIHFLLNFDLLGIGPDLEANLLARLERGLGKLFSPQRCLLTATHNHSGPVTSPLVGELGTDPFYFELAGEQTVQAARAAVESLQPALLYAASLNLPGLTYNRRALLVDGRVSISLEPGMPVVERGPVDDRLTVLVWRSPTGKNLAASLHYACHGVAVLSQGIGADIPGELSNRVAQALGAPCLFLQGASGDINPTTVTASQVDLLDWTARAWMEIQGFEDRLEPVDPLPFRMARGALPLAYAPFPDRPAAERWVDDMERIARGETEAIDLQPAVRAFKNIMNLPPELPLDPAKTAFVARVLVLAGQNTLAALDAKRPVRPALPFAVWRSGPLLLIFIGAEVFAATGLQIQALRPGMRVLPVSFLSPLIGYIPDRASLAKGGYEVNDAWRFYGHPGPFQPDTEERLIAAIAELLSAMEQDSPQSLQ